MKTLDEIARLTAEDLERIGSDENIPVPEDLKVSLPKRNPEHAWRIAAAVALLIGIGVSGYLGYREPKDTFDDPYLAYAAVEKAMNKMAGTVQYGAAKVSETELALEKINYWK
jgi:hypothetical protein